MIINYCYTIPRITSGWPPSSPLWTPEDRTSRAKELMKALLHSDRFSYQDFKELTDMVDKKMVWREGERE